MLFKPFFFAAVHEKRAGVNATADHMEIFDPGAQWGLVWQRERFQKDGRRSVMESAMRPLERDSVRSGAAGI